MPYSVHLKLHEDQYSEGRVEEWFDQLIEEHSDVERGRDRIEKSADPAIVISGATLAVASIQTLIQIYSILKDKPEVHYINLFSSDSDRYPVQVYTEAVCLVENPEKYDLYEVDEKVTLVVCDSIDDVRKVQSDVDPDGLVEDVDSTSSDSSSQEPETASEHE